MNEQKRDRVVDKVVILLSNLIFVALFLVVLLQIISRYLMYRPFIWTEEMARSLYVWLVFFGSSVLIKNYEHITVDIILSRLSDYKKVIFEIFIDILLIIFFIYVFLGGLKMMGTTKNVILPSLPMLSMSDIYLSIVVGSICSFCYLVEKIIINIRIILQRGLN
jgi:TRAP-type C4-dicarboxylate transport system permease small subunit